MNMQKYLFYQQNQAILTFLTKCNFKNFMLWKWKFTIFEKQLFHSNTFLFIYDFRWNILNFLKVWPFMAFYGLLWPFMAFIGLFGLCGLGWFFKAKNGLCWWKLNTTDLFPTIRCQNQSPNEIGHFESVWLGLIKFNDVSANFNNPRPSLILKN